MQNKALFRWSAAILIFGIVPPLVTPGINSAVVKELLYWTVCIALLCFILRVEQRPLRAALQWRPSFGSIGFGVAGAILLLLCAWFTFSIVFPYFSLPTNQARLDKIGSLSLLQLALMALRAGVVEEVIFRGYIIGRGQEILASKWLCFVISVIVFTAIHAPSWGFAHLLFVMVGAIIFGLLYLWRRDLLTVIIAHALSDWIMFMGTYARAHAA
jgi:membrane protease YdiL (CAAX protease family)